MPKTQRREKPISFNEEDTQILVKLGLNGAQAKIYLTLTTLGTANAKQISQTAKLDSSGVYRQLETLHKKGIIEKKVNTPTEYKAMPMNEAVKAIIKQKNKENAQIQQKIRTLSKKNHQKETLKEEEHMMSIIPKEDYRKLYTVRTIELAQKEIIGYTQIGRIPIAINCYYKSMKKAFERGVQYRVIAELNKPTEPILRFIQRFKNENPNFEIRFVNPILFTTFTVYDNKILHFSTEKLIKSADSPILSTNNPELIKAITELFKVKWNSAKKYTLKESQYSTPEHF